MIQDETEWHDIDLEEKNQVKQIVLDLFETEEGIGIGIQKDQEHADEFTEILDILFFEAKEQAIQRLLHMCRLHNRNVLAREIEVFIDSLNNIVKH